MGEAEWDGAYNKHAEEEVRGGKDLTAAFCEEGSGQFASETILWSVRELH